MKPLLVLAATAAVCLSCATPGPARVTEGVGETATAELVDATGRRIGGAALEQAPNGILARVKLEGAPPGEHAFHIHETGKCEPPFKTAGGHYNPRANQHGISNPQGRHAGDLPNVHVPSDGALEVTLFFEDVSLRGKHPLLDADGSALVLHAGVDDYKSDPAGNAGDRIACGVVTSR